MGGMGGSGDGWLSALPFVAASGVLLRACPAITATKMRTTTEMRTIPCTVRMDGIVMVFLSA